LKHPPKSELRGAFEEQRAFLGIFDGQEALMNDQPKMRNEFGLDRENAIDVQKERFNPVIPWVVGLVALAAVAAILMFALPNTADRDAARVQPPTITTGSGSTTDSR
jgi:hypothetical protein